ncbi:MAG: DUF2786 domain-containing protein [Microthrixaceae bacterium]
MNEPLQSNSSRTQGEDRRLATIRGLLAKAEATEFPDEAELFFAKASELISRWAIDEAMLWQGTDTTGREQPDELQLVVFSPYLTQKAVLIGAVAAAHGCRTVRLAGGKNDGVGNNGGGNNGGGNKGSEVVSVVGFPSDLRWVDTLVTSLLLQLTSAMLSQCPKGVSPSATASWRRSFIIGYAEEVGSRLEQDRVAAATAKNAASAEQSGTAKQSEHAQLNMPPSVAMVLATRSAEVQEEFRRRHPRVRSSWASSGRSASGRQAGQRAGKEASLTRGGIGHRPGLGTG